MHVSEQHMRRLEQTHATSIYHSKVEHAQALWREHWRPFGLFAQLSRGGAAVTVQLFDISDRSAIVGLPQSTTPALRQMGSKATSRWSLQLHGKDPASALTTTVWPQRSARWGDGVRLLLGMGVDAHQQTNHLEHLQRLLNERSTVRVSPAHDAPIPVLACTSKTGAPMIGVVRDVSQGGMCVAFPASQDAQISPHDDLWLSFELGEPARGLRVQGEVIRTWTIPGTPAPRGLRQDLFCVGVSFADFVAEDSTESRLLGSYVVSRQVSHRRDDSR